MKFRPVFGGQTLDDGIRRLSLAGVKNSNAVWRPFTRGLGALAIENDSDRPICGILKAGEKANETVACIGRIVRMLAREIGRRENHAVAIHDENSLFH